MKSTTSPMIFGSTLMIALTVVLLVGIPPLGLAVLIGWLVTAVRASRATHIRRVGAEQRHRQLYGY